MYITKYLHSCLVLEIQEKIVIIDPGEFTYNARVFDSNNLQSLDAILITHEHPDHCHIPFITDIRTKFPDVPIISNDSVVTKLQEENIDATTDAPDWIQQEDVPHEDVVTAVPPQNTMFTVFGQFADPGDSHHFSTNAAVVALPIQAPWGSFADALKLAESLSPKYIIPIHDWHWKDEVRKGIYQRAAAYLEQDNITFKGLETGERIEINI